MKITRRQKNNYEAWIREVANACVEKGLALRVLFKDPGEVMPTKDLLHKNMTLKAAEDLYRKKSTMDLESNELNVIVDMIRDHINKQSKGEVNLPFNDKSDI